MMIKRIIGLITVAMIATGCQIVFGPEAMDMNIQVPGDSSYTGYLNGDNYGSAEPLEFNYIIPPAHGSLTVDTYSGSFTYTPYSDEYGNDYFTYVIDDGRYESREATVNITILSLNQAPVTSDQHIHVIENHTFYGVISATDPEGDALNFTIYSSPSMGNLSINIETGQFEYDPYTNHVGTDEFKVRVEDEHGATSIVTVDISTNHS